MQLEELQAAQATAQGAIDTARTDTEAVRASMQDLQVDNQRCLEAVESVAGRREVGSLVFCLVSICNYLHCLL